MHQLIDIPCGGLHVCPSASAFTITAQCGTVWVTRAGDPRDHVVKTGQKVHLIGQGRVVIQALGGYARIAYTFANMPPSLDGCAVVNPAL